MKAPNNILIYLVFSVLFLVSCGNDENGENGGKAILDFTADDLELAVLDVLETKITDAINDFSILIPIEKSSFEWSIFKHDINEEIIVYSEVTDDCEEDCWINYDLCPLPINLSQDNFIIKSVEKTEYDPDSDLPDTKTNYSEDTGEYSVSQYVIVTPVDYIGIGDPGVREVLKMEFNISFLYSTEGLCKVWKSDGKNPYATGIDDTANEEEFADMDVIAIFDACNKAENQEKAVCEMEGTVTFSNGRLEADPIMFESYEAYLDLVDFEGRHFIKLNQDGQVSGTSISD